MEKEKKEKLKKLIESYCNIKGIDKTEFVKSCKASFGSDDNAFAKGVLETIRSDKETMHLVETINELAGWQNMEILPASEINKLIREHLAYDENDDQLVKKITKEVLGE